MSDKSFGDHTNKGVVKNPLLSSVVTGLSLDEFTQKAVLLPVTPAQAVNVRSEHTGLQTNTLAHTRHDQPIFPSGDAENNAPTLNPSTNDNLSGTNAAVVKHDEIPKATVSKAAAKSDDDFDVNEYFARLQGTRYVSAPIHSQIKDDQGAATEENLEEINLNEPEKPVGDVQQSLTADIAQNFSQLPTVLPHVASAVFSSFSNMLSLKSREQTPDESKQLQGYHDVQMKVPETTVPLMSVNEPARNVEPPPKEPPVSGSGNYRITTKKKYAQIPGLTCNDSGQSIYASSLYQSAPPSFLPAQIERDKIYSITENMKTDEVNYAHPNVETKILQQVPIKIGIEDNKDFIKMELNTLGSKIEEISITDPKVEIRGEMHSIFNSSICSQNTSNAPSEMTPTLFNVSNKPAGGSYSVDFTNTQVENQSTLYNVSNRTEDLYGQTFNPIPTQDISIPSLSSTPVISPPPMFTNVRRDQPSIGKSVLPPSVARRISANHPIIRKPTVTPTVIQNLFVPAPVDDQTSSANFTNSFGQYQATGLINLSNESPSINDLPQPSSQLTTINAPVTSEFNDSAFGKKKSSNLSSSNINETTKSRDPSIFIPRIDMHHQKSNTPTISGPTQINSIFESNLESQKPQLPHSIYATNPSIIEEKSTVFTPGTGTPSLPVNDAAIPSNDIPFYSSSSDLNFYSPGISQPQKSSPVLFNPSVIHDYSKESQQIEKEPSTVNLLSTSSISSQPTLPIPEPPKVTGGSNFRMTKKKPQYYSGPIHGFETISNNLKPVLTSVDSIPYGPLFTPEMQPLPENKGQPLPFDINNTTALPYDIVKEETQSHSTPSFDISRQTTEMSTRQEESKGFGIIGSLKSKLSSIDINTIQNSVTTFFDPGYNDVQNTANKHDDQSYYQENPSDQYSRNKESTFELFLPNIDHNIQPFKQLEDNQMIHNVPYNYQPTNPHNQSRNPYNYYQEQNIHATSSIFTYQDQHVTVPPTNIIESINTSGADPDTVKSLGGDIKRTDEKGTSELTTEVTPVPSLSIQTDAFIGSHHNLNIVKNDDIHCASVFQSGQQFSQTYQPFQDISAKSFFDTPILDSQSLDLTEYEQVDSQKIVPSDNLSTGIQDSISKMFGQQYETLPVFNLDSAKQDKILQTVDNKGENMQPDSINKLNSDSPVQCVPVSLVADPFSYLKHDSQDFGQDIQIRETNLLESLSVDDIPIVAVSSVPLFGLSTIIAEKPKEAISTEIKTSDSAQTKSKPQYNKKNTSKAFENIPTREVQPLSQANLGGEAHIQKEAEIQKEPVNLGHTSIFTEIKQQRQIRESWDIDADTEPDLNICETCREVNKPEQKETDDLTTHLIENITAPIQLLNPVEAPFTDSETSNNRIEFDLEQCEKISHITEDTIEFINAHNASELLDDIPVSLPRISNYDNSSSEDIGELQIRPNNPATPPIWPEEIILPDNSQFFERFMTNPIDDIKTDLYISNEDTHAHNEPPVGTRTPFTIPHVDNPLFPEEADKIDVSSIELDAKITCPTYYENIESSTNQDSSDLFSKDISESHKTDIKMDSFTNRVERFKKMEETKEDNLANNGSNVVTETSSVNSPSIPIASYYDTGNYAAETYYRNLLNSPSSSYVDSPSNQIRIPPGFEDEYQRRMSGVSSHLTKCFDSDSKSDVPLIPETSTQTHTSTTISVSTPDNRNIFESFHTQPNLEITESCHLLSSPPKNQSFVVKNFEKDFDSEIMVTKESVDTTFPVKASLSSDIPHTYCDDLESSSRLASYFGSPPEGSHSKSFFELSQSENHYRKDSNESQNLPGHIFFKTEDKTGQISNDNTVKYFNLMSDLTSTNNIHNIPKDQTDKIVNYFSFEYDNDVKTILNAKNNTHDKIKDKCKTKKLTENDNVTQNLNKPNDYINENDRISNKCNCEITGCIEDLLKSNVVDESYSENFHTLVVECKYCCNNLPINTGDYKIKKLINDSADNKNDMHNNMVQDNDDHRRSVTVNFDSNSLQEDADRGVAAVNENRTTTEYTPVKHHWFYRVDVDDKSIWRGFSVVDSTALEEAYSSQNVTEETVVATDGGRYDVNIYGRIRRPVYWSDKPTNVRRCSWFYKGTTDARYVPYTEPVAEKLEEEYRHGVTTGEWHRQLILPNNELVVMHGPSVMVHFLHSGAADAFSSSPQSTSRPRVVRRGHDESEIEDTEPSSIDHILLLCHGVGSACDMRFRNVEEVVDDFRATSLQLVQSHYRNSYENGIVNRVEVLPISWHSTLHSGEKGVDRRLAQITLDSIPRLRNFTNDTVLDVLFYTSPVYCQTIIDTVCSELNRIYSLFVERNPGFTGGVSLGGHSLGSVILYDLLCHQPAQSTDSTCEKNFVSSSGSSGPPSVKYPKLMFNPAALYALGSPIAIFECIRGVESLGMNFALPTCKNFFNIFHPYDPIAYRIEPLINPKLRDVKPLLVPHHKGRKRMHLELKDTMVRVGADLKQKLFESIRTTWNKWKTQSVTEGTLEKVMEEEIEKDRLNEEVKEESTQNETATPDMLGKLNAGRRVDYVLQEAPLEVINEYLFAMSSHVGYWESEDTMLMMLREIYGELGVQPDSTVPQQNMTVQRTRTSVQNETIVIDQPSTSHSSP